MPASRTDPSRTIAAPRGIPRALKTGNLGARDYFLKAFDHG